MQRYIDLDEKKDGMMVYLTKHCQYYYSVALGIWLLNNK